MQIWTDRYRNMRELVGGFLGLLAPPRCMGCDEVEDVDSSFCDSCRSLIDRSSSPSAVFEYGGPIADAIQRFKYDDRSELGAVLGALMADEAQRFAGLVTAVVPVPLHWRRRRKRGYDQAALLAKPVAKSLRVPVLFRGLQRLRNTPSQVDLPHHARRQNVAGAFAPNRLRGAEAVLLVDDVRTTGATLEAATAALEAGGVSEVHTLVLAARVLGHAT